MQNYKRWPVRNNGTASNDKLPRVLAKTAFSERRSERSMPGRKYVLSL
jgi:hypothetical protein